MRGVSWAAAGALWWREMKRFARARSRLIGTLLMPLFLYLFLATGFGRVAAPGAAGGVGYGSFLLPGILGLSILLSSTLAGISFLWDREFGFLKEIMAAPVSRLSIVLGRIAGGVTTSLLQVLIIVAVALATGFRPVSAPLAGLALAIALLTSVAFIGLGLVFASNMRDMQGFTMVMSFVIFPIFLFSGALFPLGALAPVLRWLSFLDPLTYAVDGLRACLVGTSVFPLATDVAVIAAFAVATVLLGAISFGRHQAA